MTARTSTIPEPSAHVPAPTKEAEAASHSQQHKGGLSTDARRGSRGKLSDTNEEERLSKSPKDREHLRLPMDDLKVITRDDPTYSVAKQRQTTTASLTAIEGNLVETAMASTTSLTSASTLDSPELGSPAIKMTQLTPQDVTGDQDLSDGTQVVVERSVSRKRDRTPSLQSNLGENSEIVNKSFQLAKRARLAVAESVRVADIEMSDTLIPDDEQVSFTGKALIRELSPASSEDPIDILNDNTGKELRTQTTNSLQTTTYWDYYERAHGIFYKQAEQIPKDLVNEINDMPSWFRDPELLRRLFELSIVNNTVDDEPHAPPIRIVNVVDDEATPPFEFYYSNHLWHGKGVPSPDIENLEGCDCEGKCDPRSTTCSCALRQRSLFEAYGVKSTHNGFNYDDRGRLRNNEFPIFECNAFCGCTDDCINRVIDGASIY